MNTMHSHRRRLGPSLLLALLLSCVAGVAAAQPFGDAQWRAQREQDRLQREAERDAREQMWQQEQWRRQQDPQQQREDVLRRQPEIPLQAHPGQPSRQDAGANQPSRLPGLQQQPAIPLSREPRGGGRQQLDDGRGRAHR